MCLTRSNTAYLCPNYDSFSVVEFSECHSEEVIISFEAHCMLTTVIKILVFRSGVHGEWA